MPNNDDDRGAMVSEALAVARDVAGDLDGIVITHFPDADTLDILRPGTTDLATSRAVNRAVAEEFTAQGVGVFVQKADRAAFRRWMDGRADTAENRFAWRDRGRLLQGAAALKLLGAAVAPDPYTPALGKIPGPLADRLVETYSDEDDTAFREFAETLIAAGRDDVIDLALRKARDHLGDDAACDVVDALREMAEAAEAGPSGWAELVTLPMALIQGSVPEATELGAGLAASGAFPETLDLRFLPGWRSPDALARLTATALRRVLLDLLAGQEPADLPPGDTDELAKSGFGLLLGVQFDWDIPAWEDVFQNGVRQEPDGDAQTPEDAAYAAAYESWRLAAAEASGGCVALALVAPTKVADEIAAFMEEAGGHTRGIEDIRDFVAMIRREANDEAIMCRLEVIGKGLEISLYTQAGRFLDSLTLPAARLPAPLREMPRLIEAFVPISRQNP